MEQDILTQHAFTDDLPISAATIVQNGDASISHDGSARTLSAGGAGPFDVDAGLGSWTADPARFPDGLRPLKDFAHSLGIKFGLWVEPERVNLSMVGEQKCSRTI